MIHTCNIHCHTIDIEKADLMGIPDKGKWLSFAFHIDVVIACKLTTDDEEEMVYNCTTIFTDHGDTYVIDTPYEEFLTMFQLYHAGPSDTDAGDISL
jgi:hypothetical protein